MVINISTKFELEIFIIYVLLFNNKAYNNYYLLFNPLINNYNR